MRGKKGKMTGGEEGKNLIVMPLLTTSQNPRSLKSQQGPGFSFMSSHYLTFFYWSVVLLAAWSPKMALKLDSLETVKRFCSYRPAALVL